MTVSIITPSFNQGQFIEETIKSVLNQTYGNIQYIIVDGGSTDNTMKIIDRYRDRISIVVSEKDRGQSHAINKGFGMATGELVAWLNSDDIIYPQCVERIVELAKQKPGGIIYYSAKIDFIDEHGRKFNQVKNEVMSKEYLLNRNYDVMQQGAFYSLQAVRKAGFLKEEQHYCMDLELWLRMLNEGDIYYYSAEPLAAFRLWDGCKTVASEIDFLNDIHAVLRENGMRFFSPNNRKLYVSKLRKRVKGLIQGSKVKSQNRETALV